MPSTMEYLAIVAVGLVLVISMVQGLQLSGLNEKVTQQNTALGSLVSGSNSTPNAANQGNQNPSPPAQAAPSSQMVGGC